jgi:competence protein ComEC
MSKKWKLTISVMLLACITVWLSVFSTSSDNLKVINCDVGQGDATLIIYRSFEILIDGGPDNSVLDCLSKYLPFWDRNIEAVILTHSQADHYTGLIAVIERYNVKEILANSLESSSQTYSLLKKLVLDRGITVVNPTSGMVVGSQMIQLDILHPSREYLADNYSSGDLSTDQSEISSGVLGASVSKMDPNDFSVVTLLSFGSFRFLFTGDISSEIADTLALSLSENGERPINYIKIPHHGSKSALSEKLYDLDKGGIAVISVGKNSYGHPNGEVVDLLNNKMIKVFRTDENGNVVTETDGKKIWVNN